MNISTLPAVPGARHRKKRVGRGIGSGHGKTATRGQKGQRARTGEGKRPGFEGGRNPLIRRLPKRGFRQKATGRPQPAEIVNLRQLNRFQDGERISPQRLHEARLISHPARTVKLLGDGALARRITIAVHRASRSAAAKVAEAGGSLELIDNENAEGPRPKAEGSSQRPAASGPRPTA
jgi:large subunit ribosomal protein L15